MAIRVVIGIVMALLLEWQAPARHPSVPMTRRQAAERARALAAVGRKMFFDPSLSASGQLSCSSCHDPRYAYGPPNSLPVQTGGKNGGEQGLRAAPSLRYLQAIPEFTEHFFDGENFDDSIDNGATGGLTWDGRVDRVREQARIPLFAAREMANDGPAAVISKVRASVYGAEFERLRADGDALETILEALEAFQQDDREFYPYSSKYDAWLARKARLSTLETRGMELFNDAAKGGCARCHISSRGLNGTPPQFTDYAYVALGVPRNRQIAANRDTSWFDMGLCGPERSDLRGRTKYCGQFRTPTLRNVAVRRAFFHNGAIHSLRDVVEFYATRDTNPGKWYPRGADGTVYKFDDLPAVYRPNVEMSAPFGEWPGGKPHLNGEEIDAIVAFLQTLTDGDVALR